jgi:hypothetical protein
VFKEDEASNRIYRNHMRLRDALKPLILEVKSDACAIIYRKVKLNIESELKKYKRKIIDLNN